jgi:hypothetical protein
MLGTGFEDELDMPGSYRTATLALIATTLALAPSAACIEDAVLIEGSGGFGAGVNPNGGSAGTPNGGNAGGGGNGGTPNGGMGGVFDCNSCMGMDTTCMPFDCANESCALVPAAAATPCTDDGGTQCNGLGNCVECLIDTDCVMPDLCISGNCGLSNGPLGDPCMDGADCFSGNCSPDGVCCDTPCDQLCESCVAAKNCGVPDGTCAPIAPGNDPDNECPTGECYAGPVCETGKIAFVTSAQYNGNLGGLTGADTICNQHATNACLPGTYMAWLSDSTATPNTRFTQSAIAYRKVDGTLLASNYGNLVSGNILAPLNLTELNGVPQLSAVGCPVQQMSFSATDPNGNLLATGNCNDWSATVAEASWGYNTVTNGNWTQGCSGTGGNTCSSGATLYCFQQ